MSEVKVTSGALRAATILEDERIRNILAKYDYSSRIAKMAEYIDRETAAPRLLNLCKAALCDAESRLYMLPVKGKEVDLQRQILSTQISTYKEAIAKAEGRQ